MAPAVTENSDRKRPPSATAAHALIAAGTLFCFSGCARAPSPLSPTFRGAIGTPNHGVLVDGTELPPASDGLRWLRHDDRHWAVSRFATSIARAAATVALARPPSVLRVGDLSTRTGGALAPHLSHRSGMDADLPFYVATLEGAPVESPGFVHVGSDGLARDDAHGRFLRFDTEREWLLVKSLLEDPDARVQWIFVSDVVQAMLVEWALARGDSIETVRRAIDVMRQPKTGGLHDDHLHVRTSCSADEATHGCEPVGPQRAWLNDDSHSPLSASFPPFLRDEDETHWLVLSLLGPLSP